MAVVIDKLRHPEKAHRPDNDIQRKPDWIRVKAPVSKEYQATREIVRANKLHTVCEEAACPNIGECWTKRHATMMIMGDTCTRACAFCNVKTGLPGPAGRRGARQCRPRGQDAGPEACGDHLGGPRRSGRWRGGAFRPGDQRHPCHQPRHLGGSADARFPAQGRRHRDRDGGAPRRVQPQSGNRAAALSQHPARRALFRVAAAAGAGQGTDAGRASPSRG